MKELNSCSKKFRNKYGMTGSSENLHIAHKPFFIFGEQKQSGRQFDALCLSWRKKLLDMGAQQGDLIALFGASSANYLAAVIALFSLDCTVVFCSTRELRKNIRVWLSELGCRILLNNFSKRFHNKSGMTIARKHSIIIDPQKCHTIFRTSGSTNKPKNVLHKFAAHIHSAQAVNQELNFTSHDSWLLSLPTYHVGGFAIFVRVWLAKASIVLAKSGDDMLNCIKAHPISHISLVATQLIKLLAQDKTNIILPKLKKIVLGGGPTPKWALHEAKNRGLNVVNSYGSTETASMVYVGNTWLPNNSIKLAYNGEILLKGPSLFEGYLDKQNLDSAKDKSGFFHTGDLAKLRPDNRLQIIGRKDNMIISGGENIHLEEIEREILALDYVTNAIVVPIKHQTFGEVPVAFIEMSQGYKLNKFNVAQDLADKLVKFKIPKTYFDWPKELSRPDLKISRIEFAKLASKLIQYS